MTIYSAVGSNKRKTWASYLAFKFYQDHMVSTVPGTYINCSEGLMGAYQEGNIQQFQYMDLKTALMPYRMADKIYIFDKNKATNEVIKTQEVMVKDMLKPKFWTELTMF